MLFLDIVNNKNNCGDPTWSVVTSETCWSYVCQPVTTPLDPVTSIDPVTVIIDAVTTIDPVVTTIDPVVITLDPLPTPKDTVWVGIAIGAICFTLIGVSNCFFLKISNKTTRKSYLFHT